MQRLCNNVRYEKRNSCSFQFKIWSCYQYQSVSFDTEPSPAVCFLLQIYRTEHKTAWVTRLEETLQGCGCFQLVLNSCGGIRAKNCYKLPIQLRYSFKQAGPPDIYLLHQSLHLLLVGVAHTSVLSFSLRTPRSTPVKLSSAAMVSILMNWFSRMAEPAALSDS